MIIVFIETNRNEGSIPKYYITICDQGGELAAHLWPDTVSRMMRR
jgi:hypothetical protein